MRVKRILCAALCAVMLSGLFACGGETDTQPEADETGGGQSAAVGWSGLEFDREMPLSYATQFSVEYSTDGYKKITIGNEHTEYLVIPEGAVVPEGVPEDVTVLQQPLDKIYLVASAAMDNFSKLDSVNAITLSGRKESDWYIDDAKAAMQAGNMVYAGKYSEPDYELILSSGCSLAIENTMIYHSPEVLEKLQSLGIPVLVETSSYEEEPFGRMEWIKLYAALLNKEDLAEKLFNEKMASLAGVLEQEPSGKTVAFFYITSKDAVNVRKSGDYIAKSIGIAGGEYISFDESGDESAQSTVNIQMEAFYEKACNADVIIYNSIVDGEIDTIDGLIALSPLLADFKAVREGNVWCLTKNFYQESFELGDLVLDVNTVLTSPGSDDLRFLRKMK